MATYGSGTYGSGKYGVSSAVGAIEQDSYYPPRVALAVTGMAPGDIVTVYRVVGSERTAVRGGDGITLTDSAFALIDAEAPFGVEVSYVVVGNDDYEYEIGSPLTLELPGGKVALSDAISGLAAEVVITAWPDKRRDRRNTVFAVGGRNIVVLGQRGGFTGSFTATTETEQGRENLDELLDAATSGILQVRQAGGYYDVDCYVAVTGDTTSRFSQDGSDERRLFTLDVVETAPWAPALPTKTSTYADLAAAYAGLTYLDLADDYDAYLDLALGDFS